MSKVIIFNTQYQTFLIVLATVLVLVIGFIWFLDRRDERKLQEHLFELQADLSGNRQLQLQQVAGPRLIF